MTMHIREKKTNHEVTGGACRAQGEECIGAQVWRGTASGRSAMEREVTKNPLSTLAEVQTPCSEMGETSKRTTVSAALHRSVIYGKVARLKFLFSKNKWKMLEVWKKKSNWRSRTARNKTLWSNECKFKLFVSCLEETRLNGCPSGSVSSLLTGSLALSQSDQQVLGKTDTLCCGHIFHVPNNMNNDLNSQDQKSKSTLASNLKLFVCPSSHIFWYDLNHYNKVMSQVTKAKFQNCNIYGKRYK